MGAGAGLAVAVALWPWVVAWRRGLIDRSRLEEVVRRKLGRAGIGLVGRLALAAAVGPFYMWYLLARTCMTLLDAAQPAVPN